MKQCTFHVCVSALTSGVHELLPPPVPTLFSSQTSALQSTSWNWQVKHNVNKKLIWSTTSQLQHARTHAHNSPEDRKTPCPDVLAAMLDTSYQVRYELVDGALVLDWARHTLSYLHFVALTVERHQSIFSHSIVKSCSWYLACHYFEPPTYLK